MGKGSFEGTLVSSVFDGGGSMSSGGGTGWVSDRSTIGREVVCYEVVRLGALSLSPRAEAGRPGRGRRSVGALRPRELRQGPRALERALPAALRRRPLRFLALPRGNRRPPPRR